MDDGSTAADVEEDIEDGEEEEAEGDDVVGDLDVVDLSFE